MKDAACPYAFGFVSCGAFQRYVLTINRAFVVIVIVISEAVIVIEFRFVLQNSVDHDHDHDFIFTGVAPVMNFSLEKKEKPGYTFT